MYSVSRDFAKSCQTPMLVLPDDIVAHPLQVSVDAGAKCRDHGVSLEGAAGVEGPHHQPRAHVPEAASHGVATLCQIGVYLRPVSGVKRTSH